jgi:hypothetical protein
MFVSMWVLGLRLALSALEPGKQRKPQQGNPQGDHGEQ